MCRIAQISQHRRKNKRPFNRSLAIRSNHPRPEQILRLRLYDHPRKDRPKRIFRHLPNRQLRIFKPDTVLSKPNPGSISFLYKMLRRRRIHNFIIGYSLLSVGYSSFSFQSLVSRILIKASCGICTLPTLFIRFLPSFCFFKTFIFRVTSPP